MYQELDQVELITNHPIDSILSGSIGTIVYIYLDEITYEVEFVQSGKTKILTLKKNEFKRYPF